WKSFQMAFGVLSGIQIAKIMRIASMNIQNLYHRDLSFKKVAQRTNLQQWEVEFQNLMEKPKKDNQTLDRLRELSFSLGFGRFGRGPFMRLRSAGGVHYIKPMDHGRGPRASGLSGWNGWMELKSFPLSERIRRSKLECIV